jgi:predicted membrane chloride channel (bestrophin family)
LNTEQGRFSTLIVVLMAGAVIVLLLALWSGFTFIFAQGSEITPMTIISLTIAILLVVSFLVGMIFTLQRKRWGFWLFAVASVLMFVGGGLPGTGSAMNQLGAAGFLGAAAAALVYRQRDLLS